MSLVSIKGTNVRKLKGVKLSGYLDKWNVTFKGTNGRQKTYEISHVYSIFKLGGFRLTYWDLDVSSFLS